MKAGRLAVLGSINADHILNLEQFPSPGETVIGKHYNVAFGGKGANQAVAAGRCGADIAFIACVGADDIGQRIRQQLADDRVDVSAVEAVPGQTTGVALIWVNDDAENMIAIHSGANAALSPEVMARFQQKIAEASALLMQLESPLETVTAAAQLARRHGTRVILNPAPARPLPDKLLSLVDIMTPNETEAQHLTGIRVETDDDARRAAQALHDKGVGSVIITLGRRGAWVSEQGRGQLIPGFQVEAVDTIAAGDTFNGALLTALLEEMPMLAAVRFAHAAAAIAVTRSGGQPSVPWRNEIEAFLQEQE
ncbi:ribokinase [Lonsdalea populi]|uniref:Ribokinase n=1 Tax=Lonsdalea populi TaxID=1172565 RepID=A0A3N0UMY6_9GAMM|nr:MULTISPECIES: ribokinase [Lonsdalea]RAT17741.1 ribokinase [Lonsdalea quercina]RAT27527.1 ribokinase [Lonsdalea populi]RAT38937.1 ribokinase [Lonsdalea populi]RAT40776.1 ribokinase [Lonsdalea populi]RAT49024.1 ribokinase [Lonsdalea populi]